MQIILLSTRILPNEDAKHKNYANEAAITRMMPNDVAKHKKNANGVAKHKNDAK